MGLHIPLEAPARLASARLQWEPRRWEQTRASEVDLDFMMHLLLDGASCRSDGRSGLYLPETLLSLNSLFHRHCFCGAVEQMATCSVWRKWNSLWKTERLSISPSFVSQISHIIQLSARFSTNNKYLLGGWVGRRIAGWVAGRMDGWINGLVDGWMDK